MRYLLLSHAISDLQTLAPEIGRIGIFHDGECYELFGIEQEIFYRRIRKHPQSIVGIYDHETPVRHIYHDAGRLGLI